MTQYNAHTIINEQEPQNEMDRYTYMAAKTAVFPQEHAFSYLSLGLVGEAGELANKVKKILRGDYEGKGAATWDDVRLALLDECGDCLWYLSQFIRCLDGQLSEVAKNNLEKLRRRKEANTVKGSGDER